MRKKLYSLLTIFALTLASSVTAFAAPEVMPDGGVFDAEYYAQNNPDVAAAFGMDKELLYSHYVNCGKAEGRLAVAPVELTKEELVTNTAKRLQLENECKQGKYDYIYDKAGYRFEPSEVMGYFSDVAIEQFINFEALVNYVKNVELYRYADEVTFASSYYYQEIKKKAEEDALLHVNDRYWQFHFQTKEHNYSRQEYFALVIYMGNFMQPYYGENWRGIGTRGEHYIEAPDGTLMNRFGKTDGYCIEMGIYRSEEDANSCHKGWNLCSTC